MTGALCAAAGAGLGNPITLNPSYGVNDFVLDPGDALANFRLESDGDIGEELSGGFVGDIGDWLSPEIRHEHFRCARHRHFGGVEQRLSRRMAQPRNEPILGREPALYRDDHLHVQCGDPANFHRRDPGQRKRHGNRDSRHLKLFGAPSP